MLPGERVIAEHYRLGSTCAILSRSFCDVNKISDMAEIQHIFENGLKDIRAFEKKCDAGEIAFEENKRIVKDIVEQISAKISGRNV